MSCEVASAQLLFDRLLSCVVFHSAVRTAYASKPRPSLRAMSFISCYSLQSLEAAVLCTVFCSAVTASDFVLRRCEKLDYVNRDSPWIVAMFEADGSLFRSLVKQSSPCRLDFNSICLNDVNLPSLTRVGDMNNKSVVTHSIVHRPLNLTSNTF